MTNLTDKWKKGELPEGWYYVKDEDGQIIIAEYYAYCIDKETNEAEYDWSCCSEPEQIIAPVPSYEEWQELKEFADYSIHNRDELTRQINFWIQENTKLKDLLKEVLRHDLSLKEVAELTRKIAQVLGEE